MVDPSSINWEVLPEPAGLFRQIRSQGNPARYDEGKEALKAHLCEYFGSGNGDCLHKAHKSIATVGGGTGRKHLKVRWLIPGAGKRGGLRLAVVVDCAARKVWLAGAWIRREDPTDDEFNAAFASVS